MNKFLRFFLYFLLSSGVLLPGLLQAAGPAGIVLYSNHDDEPWLLLADHKGNNRGWAAFGGMHEAGETGIDTAVRETVEETRRFFSTNDLRNKISDQVPVISGLFRLYFAEVDYVEASEVETHTVNSSDTVSMERLHYTWVPISEIRHLVCAESILGKDFSINPAYLPAAKSKGHYWHIWIQNMRDAKSQKALPWKGEEPFCSE